VLKYSPKESWTYEQKKQALHDYIELKFGFRIPDKAYCHNHQSPFDFVASAFFEQYPLIIALGPRLGGKTFDFAILAICEAIANDECELANFGSTEAQALRCYGYITSFLENKKDLAEKLDGKPTLSKTKLKNKSWMQTLTATFRGVNSPHPQKVKADEVELIPWVILQEAFNMPKSTDLIDATMVLGSTRKFAAGPMQRLIDSKMAEVFTFCIWDVIEPWPEDVELQNKIKNAFMLKYGNLDLLPKDLTRFNGFYKWKDLLLRIPALDEDVFRAQLLCEKPDSGGLIYPKFDEILNDAPDFQIVGNKLYQIWEDFGYARPDHPDAINFVDVNLQRMTATAFNELYLFEMSTQDIIIEVIQKLQEVGLVEERLKNIGREELLGWKPQNSPAINYREFFTRIEAWICDYHGLTEIADRRKYGCPIPQNVQAVDHEGKVLSKMYLKENGIPHVRNFIDDRRFKYVMKNCPESRNDFFQYSKKRLLNGQWGNEVEKKNDHAPDLVHYGLVWNWPDIAYVPFDLPDGMPKELKIQNQQPKIETPTANVTEGLWNKSF
jgi:hypothetical protein